MTAPALAALDVLVVDASPSLLAAVEEAGHRAHTCSEPGAAAFPCRALIDGERCPLEDPVDVAITMASNGDLADGARCAVRSRVPVVAIVDDVDETVPAWFTAVADDIDGAVACLDEVAAKRYEAVEDAFLRIIEPTLRRASIDPTTVSCSIRRDGDALRIDVRGAGLGRASSALAVRAVEAVRAAGEPHATAYVAVHDS